MTALTMPKIRPTTSRVTIRSTSDSPLPTETPGTITVATQIATALTITLIRNCTRASCHGPPRASPVESPPTAGPGGLPDVPGAVPGRPRAGGCSHTPEPRRESEDAGPSGDARDDQALAAEGAGDLGEGARLRRRAVRRGRARAPDGVLRAQALVREGRRPLGAEGDEGPVGPEGRR